MKLLQWHKRNKRTKSPLLIQIRVKNDGGTGIGKDQSELIPGHLCVDNLFTVLLLLQRIRLPQICLPQIPLQQIRVSADALKTKETLV